MILPEEFNYEYPELFWKANSNRFSAKILTNLFKDTFFDLGNKLEHFNTCTYAFFETKNGLISDIQHTTLTFVLENQGQYKTKMESAITDYIQNEVINLLEPDEYTELIKKKISDCVLLHHFHLPYTENEMIIGFEFECLWDIEHGLGIKIINDKISEVGMADVAF